MGKIRQNQRGMTLIEVLIAMAMLAVLGTVLLATFNESYRVKTEAGRHTVAGNLAQWKLEEILLEDFAGLSNQGNEAAPFAFTQVRVGNYVYWVDVVTPLGNPNLKEVTVNVSWPGSGERKVSLGTLVGNK